MGSIAAASRKAAMANSTIGSFDVNFASTTRVAW
jgi:hypothetical protein